MCNELKTNINSLNLILDEKKCGTLKYAVEHIQLKIKEALCLPMGSDDQDCEGHMRAQMGMQDIGIDDDGSGDDVQLKIRQNDSSSDDEEEMEGEN